MGGRETRPCDCEPAPWAPATWRDLWRRPRWRVVARALPWVVGVLLVGAIAVPNMRGACVNWNDVSAYWTLTTVARSQDEFRRSGVLDLDGDGRAEFGSFRELSGAAPARGGDRVLRPLVLSGAFRTLDAGDAVVRPGYRFRMYVPARDGSWVAVDAEPGDASADGAERAFLCYAGPNDWVTGPPQH